MKSIIIPLFFIVTSLFYTPKQNLVYIQPLGFVPKSELVLIKNTIESFYGFKCQINESENLSDDLLSTSKTRYEANKILQKFNSNKKIIIVTQKDIVHHNKKRNILEWGIIGLGYMPGNVCVVSTYRIKNKVSREKFESRLTKVSLHEMGHNLGLNHCTKSKSCLMNDANGTVKTIDKEKIMLCNSCKKQISLN